MFLFHFRNIYALNYYTPFLNNNKIPSSGFCKPSIPKHQLKLSNNPFLPMANLAPAPAARTLTLRVDGDMEYTPAKIGVEVRGIDLKQQVPDEIVEQIKKDVHKHRLLIFKDQGVVSPQRHVEISRWFGELESTFCKHPKSPHPDIFRVSNCLKEGCTQVGRTGWHIDGSFMEKPFSYAVYHMVSVPKIGNTAFVPFKELVESLSAEKRVRWERLWRTDHQFQVVSPMVYPHPVTSDPTLCLHLGMTGCFIWDYGTERERPTKKTETDQILKEIFNEITKDSNRLVYSHKWEVGDFIISDNLAIGHEATPETQLPVEKVGLRVLHRTTVAGKWIPTKCQKLEACTP